ncbi:hypothetical protein SERMPB_00066 (plasmid) [Serratia marcescens]
MTKHFLSVILLRLSFLMRAIFRLIRRQRGGGLGLSKVIWFNRVTSKWLKSEDYMAGTKFYTQDQLEEAKLALESLPDLTPNKISRTELLESLKENIISLAKSKGYTASEIKSALQMVDVSVSEKAISEIIRASKNPVKKRGKSPVKQVNNQSQ